MKLKEITPENVGAICGLFRVKKLNERQFDFADRHHISTAAISYFERGVSISLVTFLAYVSDGLEEFLDEITVDMINAILTANKIKKRDFVRATIQELGSNNF